MPTKAPLAVKNINGASMFALRKKLKLNQSEFWAAIGVTQSGGSRYESGRDMPKPVRIATAFIYGDEISKNRRAIFR